MEFWEILIPTTANAFTSYQNWGKRVFYFFASLLNSFLLTFWTLKIYSIWCKYFRSLTAKYGLLNGWELCHDHPSLCIQRKSDNTNALQETFFLSFFAFRFLHMNLVYRWCVLAALSTSGMLDLTVFKKTSRTKAISQTIPQWSYTQCIMVMPHILCVHLDSFALLSVLKNTHTQWNARWVQSHKTIVLHYTVLCTGNWETECVCTLFLGHWMFLINSFSGEFSVTSY